MLVSPTRSVTPVSSWLQAAHTGHNSCVGGLNINFLLLAHA